MNFGISKADNFFDENDHNQIYSIECQPNAGFHLGPVSNVHLGEYFDLRLLINLSFGQRNLDLSDLLKILTQHPSLSIHTMKLASTYLEFPLLLKYKAAPMNNFKPYLIAG